MIDKKTITEIIENEIADTDLFLVDVSVSSGNVISVVIDSYNGVPIITCIELSKAIEGHFDREVEDFELQVASAGIGQPFQVFKQYHKYINKDVEVLTTEGIKFSGKLITVGDNEIEIEVEEMEKVEGKKKKQLVVKNYSFTLDQIKSTKDIITF
ncbi:ribosome assembly cofactor RimP [Labilibaculum euxinus]